MVIEIDIINTADIKGETAPVMKKMTAKTSATMKNTIESASLDSVATPGLAMTHP